MANDSKNLWINEVGINRDKDYCIYETEPYETAFTDKGKLFKACCKEFGKCISKVYIDQDDKAVPVGWVFEKSQKYQDTNEKYIQETWITVFKSEPVKEVRWMLEYA